ncbi:MAG: type II secretion system protein [Candidatus Gastranaerophilales bacterium]
MTKNLAFTLAEVLITLGIIGVVAAMTMPNLINNMQSEALAKKKLLFENRLEEAMNQMRFHEKLTGYDSAEDFVAELGKYLKINETCDVDNMQDCFPSTTINSCSKEIETSDLITGEDFASNILVRDYSSYNIGVVFADGVKAIVNYDLDCEWLDPYEGGASRSEATQCVAIVADVNGNAGKNAIGSDIFAINSTFGVQIADLCWDTSNAIYSPIDTCDGTSEWDSLFTTVGIEDFLITNPDYSISFTTTSCQKNYWAGAYKACKEAGKRLPTKDELSALALDYLYETSGEIVDNVSVVGEYIPENFNTLNIVKTSSGYGLFSDSGTTNVTQAGTVRLYETYYRVTGNPKSQSSMLGRCVSD